MPVTPGSSAPLGAPDTESSSPAPVSDTEKAARFFVAEVSKHIGDEVLHVERLCGEEGPGAEIRVYVKDRLTPEADAVYDLASDMYRRFPTARIDVWVTKAVNEDAAVR